MASGQPQPHHLVVLVHGLADTLHAWDNCVTALRKMPTSHDFLFHASAVNGRFKTHDGFDKCGSRLAEEIQAVVKRHPQLTMLSVLGHSMGGMIARYALGTLFRPSDGTICGLRPVHFITLATPHLGLTVDDGPAQVPFVAWAGQLPLMGRGVKGALQAVAHCVARTVFSGTGRHFLALDGVQGELPLLMLMVMDAPDKGQYFFSALRAFASRACYGNVGRDHWVSWENSTVRGTEDLPYIAPEVVRHGRGVVREDPPSAGISSTLLSKTAASPAPVNGLYGSGTDGFGAATAAKSLNAAAGSTPAVATTAVSGRINDADGVSQEATKSPEAPGRGAGGVRDELAAALDCSGAAEDAAAPTEAGSTAAVAATETTTGRRSPSPLSTEGLEAAARRVPTLHGAAYGGSRVTGSTAAPAGGLAGGSRGTGAAPSPAAEGDEVALEAAVAESVESPEQVVSFALTRLRQLPWRRVDVSFAGARMGTAHNNIQMTRWTNRVGAGVLEHLRGHMQAVEELLRAQGAEA